MPACFEGAKRACKDTHFEYNLRVIYSYNVLFFASGSPPGALGRPSGDPPGDLRRPSAGAPGAPGRRTHRAFAHHDPEG